MKTQRLLAGVRILSLIGQQGTGKSTLAKQLAEKIGGQHIEASEVVKAIHGDLPRSEMPKTNANTQVDPEWLGRAIADRISNITVILSGVREDEVHQYMRKEGASLRVISLWAPEQERFIRVKNNGKVEHYKEFVKHGQTELGIGLNKLLEQYPPMYVTSWNTEDQVIDLILENKCSLLS